VKEDEKLFIIIIFLPSLLKKTKERLWPHE